MRTAVYTHAIPMDVMLAARVTQHSSACSCTRCSECFQMYLKEGESRNDSPRRDSLWSVMLPQKINEPTTTLPAFSWLDDPGGVSCLPHHGLFKAVPSCHRRLCWQPLHSMWWCPIALQQGPDYRKEVLWRPVWPKAKSFPGYIATKEDWHKMFEAWELAKAESAADNHWFTAVSIREDLVFVLGQYTSRNLTIWLWCNRVGQYTSWNLTGTIWLWCNTQRVNCHR